MKYICDCGEEYEVEPGIEYECPKCKHRFTAETYETPKRTQICPFCNSKISLFATKCPRCGEWINGESPKSRNIHLCLALFFGNLGIGEFYAKNYIPALIILSMNFIGIFFEHDEIYPCIFAWLLSLVCFFERKDKKNRMFYTIIIIFTLAIVACYLFFNHRSLLPNA